MHNYAILACCRKMQLKWKKYTEKCTKSAGYRMCCFVHDTEKMNNSVLEFQADGRICALYTVNMQYNQEYIHKRGRREGFCQPGKKTATASAKSTINLKISAFLQKGLTLSIGYVMNEEWSGATSDNNIR